ncbi:hypothetical protein [Dehalogenimonas formicexedens]|nr:hypothetical protein [Dehalogenimonas formicexedens]
MAKELRKIEQQQAQIGSSNMPKSDSNHSSELSICPKCGQTSLFHNWVNNAEECFKPGCELNPRSTKQKTLWFESTTIEYKETISTATGGLNNPSLLSVKMFLADIRSWRREYQENVYVCADFAQDVVDKAAQRGIKCGYVVIRFANHAIGHAVNAFQTDWGLKFFEPQSGNEEDVIVGRRYSGVLAGVPGGSKIAEIEIRWNDGSLTRLP